MKRYMYIVLFIKVLVLSSCTDYLDIVPDNIATIESAFETRMTSEKFLFGCFNYLPNSFHHEANPALFGSDELWYNPEQADWYFGLPKKIVWGNQEATNPLYNYWDGGNGGRNLWIGIRDCNIFLENIYKPYDLPDWERKQWVAEVKFLKAYFHYYLFQLYGPIPIMDRNISVSTNPEDVRVYRNTTDEVVDYIAQLLDEAALDLPMRIQQMVASAGRPTKPIALAVKAKLLTLAASPLFNGNKDYVGYQDNRGVNIFGDNVGVVDIKKWKRAAVALKNAIDTCHLAEHGLYYYTPVYTMSDSTALKLQLRGAVTDKWNKEIVWGDTHTSDFLRLIHPRLERNNEGCGASEFGTTLKVAEFFYSNKGVPIDEDLSFDYVNRYKYKKAVADESGYYDHYYYIKEGEETAILNFNREPRFYASLGFDRGIWEGAGVTDDTKSFYIQNRRGEAGGFRSSGEHQPTGYFNKRIVHPETTISNANYMEKRYAFPIIRMADLYLLYSEVLNEIKSTPDEEVYKWIDMVRERAGLKGVVESWSNYSNNPTKPSSQYGMRQIIKQERSIELSGEYHRYHDLRRWKDAVKEYNNSAMQGWNYKGETAEEYYNVTTYYNKRKYSLKDYLWPISNNSILVNPNLVQNPGW